MKYTSKSSAETRKLGKQFSKTLDSPSVLLFYGDLGAGKTCFIQGLAEGLGMEKKIKSPTFVFRRDYHACVRSKAGESKKHKLIHLDLYRIQTREDLESIEWDEILNEEAIIAVEWSENIKGDLPKNRIEIKIEEKKEGERKFSIKNFSI